MALIDSSIFCTPFGGYDYYQTRYGRQSVTKDKRQAVWNYPDGDFVYFDGIISEVSLEQALDEGGR